MARVTTTILSALLMVPAFAIADEVLYRYEGDVLPYDESAGWLIANPCDGPCSESLENGHFVLTWSDSADMASYTYVVARAPGQPPPTLWVEWHFRSDHPISPNFYTCDAWFATQYGAIHDLVFMFGDAVVSFSGDDAVFGLEMGEFHTHRFESADGDDYFFAVDGLVFTSGTGINPNSVHAVNFGGQGGCDLGLLPTRNEWDFVRYGTISYGEQIVAGDPPTGYIDARLHPALDRFVVTFDEPNYVYLDEITVEVTGGVQPVVTRTRRREQDQPDTVEIVLDRPIAHGQATRFTFDDGVAVNIVEYEYAQGDTDGDGDADLADFAGLANCFGGATMPGPCPALDTDGNGVIDWHDYAVFASSLSVPGR